MKKQSSNVLLVVLAVCFMFFTLSALAVRKINAEAAAVEETCETKPANPARNGELLWESASRHFLSFVFQK